MTKRRTSPETRAKLRAIAAERATRRRYYIQLNVSPAACFRTQWGGVGYVRNVWPKLFKSYEDAISFAEKVDPFRCDPPGRRVHSISIETTYISK